MIEALKTLKDMGYEASESNEANEELASPDPLVKRTESLSISRMASVEMVKTPELKKTFSLKLSRNLSVQTAKTAADSESPEILFSPDKSQNSSDE